MRTLELQRLIDSFLNEKELKIQEETNYQILQERWDSSSSGSELQKQIEVRMMELIKTLSKDRLPSWFLNLLQNSTLSRQPAFIQKALEERCKELLSEK